MGSLVLGQTETFGSQKIDVCVASTGGSVSVCLCGGYIRAHSQDCVCACMLTDGRCNNAGTIRFSVFMSLVACLYMLCVCVCWLLFMKDLESAAVPFAENTIIER